MASAIDPTVIGAGNVDKASVRLQFERARDEISALQVARPTSVSFGVVSSVDVSFTAGYTLFRLTLWNLQTTIATDIFVRSLTAGVPDAGATDYDYNRARFEPALTTLGTASAAINVAPALQAGYPGNRLTMLITAGTVINPFNISAEFNGINSSVASVLQLTSGKRNLNGAKSGIQIYPNGSTFQPGKYILEPVG